MGSLDGRDRPGHGGDESRERVAKAGAFPASSVCGALEGPEVDGGATHAGVANGGLHEANAQVTEPLVVGQKVEEVVGVVLIRSKARHGCGV